MAVLIYLFMCCLQDFFRHLLRGYLFSGNATSAFVVALSSLFFSPSYLEKCFLGECQESSLVAIACHSTFISVGSADSAAVPDLLAVLEKSLWEAFGSCPAH